MRKQLVSGTEQRVVERYVISDCPVFEHKVTMAQGVKQKGHDLCRIPCFATNAWSPIGRENRI